MLFLQEQYEYLAAGFSDRCFYEVQQFENQELVVKLLDSVQGKKCIVIGSLTAPLEQSLTLLLLLHALIQGKASSVTLYAPYLGYQRQDLYNVGLSHGFVWADALLLSTGVCRVVTIEAHNYDQLLQATVSVLVQTSEQLFIHDMARYVSLGFTFVYPDAGAIKRSTWIYDFFPHVSYGFFLKKRNFQELTMHDFQGKIGKKVMVYDDILDSGQTLIQTCMALKLMGVEEIVIFVTHAFFHGVAWNDLWALGVKVLFCTNSTPPAHQINHERIHVKSITPLIKNIVDLTL